MILTNSQHFHISVKGISPYNLELVLNALYGAFNVEHIDIRYHRIRGTSEGGVLH